MINRLIDSLTDPLFASSPPLPRPGPGRFPARLALAASGFWLAAQLSTIISSGPGLERMVWLPSGLAAAALLRWGTSVWPAVMVAGSAVALASGAGTWASLAAGVAASAEAALAAWLLRRLGFDGCPTRLREATLFVAVALGCALLGATLEQAAAPAAGRDAAATPLTWWIGWIGRALGVLLLTPVLLRVGRRRHRAPQAAPVIESVALAIATVGLSLAVFTAMGHPHMFNPMSYALFPLLLWAVLRLGPGPAASLLLSTALVAVWGTAHGNGPFALAGAEASAGSLYLYLSVATVATLALGSAIADRARVADALAASERQYRELVETMNEGVIAVDSSGRVRFANGPFARMAARQLESIVGATVSQLVRGGVVDWPAHPSAHGQGLESFDAQLQRADGTHLEVTVSPRIVRDELNRPSGWLAVIADITERRRTDDVLRWIARATAPLTGEALLRELMRHLAGAFRLSCAFITECVDQPVTRVRVLACWRAGAFAPVTEYELSGTPCERSVQGCAVTCIRDQLEQQFPGERGAGARGYFGVPVLDSGAHRVIGHIAVLSESAMDETMLSRPLFQILTSRAAAELRRLRAEAQARQHLQQLAQVSRALALGEMGSAIAHELNQPLAAVATYAHACRRLIEAGRGGEEVRHALQRTADQAEKAGQILRRLRGFMATGTTLSAPTDLASLIHETVDLAQSEARQRRVELRVELDADVPPVHVDGIQVQQVILNLLRNAIEATGAKGQPRRWVWLGARRSGDGVEVSVTDSGPGVPSTLAERIFEPFFTTKPEGTGIGLAISRSIAEAHGGRLKLQANAGGGACFVLWLPRPEVRDAL